MMFDIRWMRSFRPWHHLGHYAWLDGKWHGFDTTLYPQARTSPELCELHHGADLSIVHFNWAIGMYRLFQRSGGSPIEDDRFRILLIRLLTDALDRGERGARPAPVDLPGIEELVLGLTDASRSVTYRQERTAANYAQFRELLSRLYRALLFDDVAVEVIEQRLKPFDAAFAYRTTEHEKRLTSDAHRSAFTAG
jgi:hypothetical protein